MQTLSVSGLLSTLVLAHASLLLAQVPADPAWQQVEGILQAPAVDGGGYVRYNLPRADLQVRVGDVTILPSLALTSWAGFTGAPDSATAMGDLVVTAPELSPVLSELVRQGVEVTAIHNHLIGETPEVVYVHFHSTGTAVDIARRLHAAVQRTATPLPVSHPSPGPLTIDSAAVFEVLGKHGKASGPLAQVSFVLVPGAVTMHGQTILPALGYASPINVQQVSPSRAVATGDFAISGDQLQPLLGALTANGITATAVHSHLVGEEPTIYFVHFWGDASLPELLRGLRAALEAVRP